MSTRKIVAVRALGRWRAFQEALAERRSLLATTEAGDARATLSEARATATAIVRRRMTMLGAARLDLGRLEFVAEMEQHAWDRVSHHETLLARAEDAAAVAQQAHLDARAQTHVVDSRCERLVAAEVDFLEKQGFDRMAALRPRSDIGEHDD